MQDSSYKANFSLHALFTLQVSTAAIKQANKIMLHVTVIEKVIYIITTLTLPVITVKALFPAMAMVYSVWLIMDLAWLDQHFFLIKIFFETIFIPQRLEAFLIFSFF